MSAGLAHPPDSDHDPEAWTAWVAGEMAVIVAELDAWMVRAAGEAAQDVARELDEEPPSRP